MRRSVLFAATLLLVPSLAFAGFRASTFRKETRNGADAWNAAAAVDNDLATAWMIDPDAENEGSWVEIDLPRSEVDKLMIVTGWLKDPGVFADHSRIKTARVEVYGSATDDTVRLSEQTVTFTDTPAWQTIELNNIKVGGELTGGRVRVVVTEVYPGEDYPTLAVSEVLVVLKDIDMAPGDTKLRTPPAASAEGKPPENLMDGNPKTFWAAPAAGEVDLELKTDGYGLSSFGLHNGPLSNARAKKISLTVNNVKVEYDVADKPEMQWFRLPAVVGYTGSAWGGVALKVVETWPGKTDQATAITDVQLRYTNYEGL